MKSIIQQVLSLGLSVVGLSVLSSCDSGPKNASIERLASPQALTFLSPTIVAVTDSSYASGEWGEGRLILIDLEREARIGAWFTPLANPQALNLDHDQLSVVSSGLLNLDGEPKGSASGLQIYHVNDLLSTSDGLNLNVLSLIDELWINLEPKGAYLVDLTTQDHEREDDRRRFNLSSGIEAFLLNVEGLGGRDTGQPRVKIEHFNDEESLSLSAVERWGEKFVLVEFNQDRLYVYDEEGERFPCAPELGQYEGVMEGAQTPVIVGDRLWVSFGLSGRLIHLDLNDLDLSDPQCKIDPFIYHPPLGQVPNDLLVRDDEVLVLHSAERAIWRYHIPTGELSKRHMLPEQTNPWHMGLSPDQSTLVVSEWLRGGLTLLDLNAQGGFRQLSPDLLAPPSAPKCLAPTELKDFEGTEFTVPSEGLTFTWEEISSESDVSSRDLRGAPQIALLFTDDSGGARIEFKEREDSAWQSLSSFNEISLFHALTESDSSYVESILLSESPLGTLFTKSSRDHNESILQLDPCELFSPKRGALRLPLISEREASQSPSMPSHETLLSGKVSLHSMKITPLGSKEIRLRAISYRRW